MSLKDKLLNHCICVNYTKIETVYSIAKDHKQSHAERQMRLIIEETALSPYWGKQILPDKNHKGHIVGYKTTLKGQTENKKGELKQIHKKTVRQINYFEF